jgi:hemerythrin-like domain-containing protein
MRITKNLRADQETINRFLAVFGGGSAMLGHSKRARPGFFVIAHDFIHEYIEEDFFRKEELLMKALEDSGFSPDDGPIGSMRTEQKKSREAAKILINSAKQWQAGDEEARTEVIWAASEYSSILHHHLDRLKNLIFPLLEQNVTVEDEHRIAEGLNNILFENTMKGASDKYMRVIESLEDELSDWKSTNLP